jgi:peptide/nickel transport system substrate-binding protein
MRIGLALLLALAACAKRDPPPAFDPAALPYGIPADPEPRRGGTFVFGHSADPKGLDPATITDGESVMVVTNLFDTLVAIDPDTLAIVPALAESWESTPDGRAWTFRLREGVRFHDGTPCDAAAVAFSFERQRDPAHPAHTSDCAYWLDYFKDVERTEALDARTVRLSLARPYAALLSILTLFSASVVSPAAFASEGVDASGKYQCDFARKPVGTGPFRFKEWRIAERIVLEANPTHFRGRPAIDALVFRPIGHAQSRMRELLAGGVHGIHTPDLVDVPRAAANPDLVVLSRPGLNVGYLAMNNDKPPFQDVRVRRAIALAIDKRRLVEAAYNGMADVAETMCPPGIDGHLAFPTEPPDPARARALLAEAGFPEGFATELWYGDATRTYLPDPDTTAVQIQQDLAAIGVRATLRKMVWTAFLAAAQRGDHPMCLLGWMADFKDADNFLYGLLDKENARPGSSQNVSFYRGERVHELLVRARGEMDLERRVELYQEAQRILREDAPTVPLAHGRDFRVFRKEVRGFTIHPVGGEYFRTVSFGR